MSHFIRSCFRIRHRQKHRGKSSRNSEALRARPIRSLESLEPRCLLSADCSAQWHNPLLPEDVNADTVVSAVDVLAVVNAINAGGVGYLCDPLEASGESKALLDVSNDGWLSALDALLVVNRLNAEAEAAHASYSDYQAQFNIAESLGAQNLLTEAEVERLLQRASQASPSSDAIIAVVDRTGRILGVRVEAGVAPGLIADKAKLTFAIDGAVAKARTAAFFSSNAAPLTSRTVRFISQSTMTQREVESSPGNPDERFRGPGFVAPIGVGGHFPPQVSFAPQVDLFAIEHQSRDRALLDLGPDGMFGTADDIQLKNRFNVDPIYISHGAEAFFKEWPDSYGVQTGLSPVAEARGIATLPGGIPLYKVVTDAAGNVQQRPNKQPALPDINLVGGIGVFFPGPDGFASYEQGFVHSAQRGGVTQLEAERTNAPRVLESEFIALMAAAGGGLVGPSAFVRDLSSFNAQLAPLPNFVVPTGRIDLVGITLEIFGPTPTRDHPIPGIDRLLNIGRSLGPLGIESGSNYDVTGLGEAMAGDMSLPGQAVPEGWLVAPHDASDGSLTAAQVKQIIEQGIVEADKTRAAIRLDIDNNFKPGARTRMVFAVADTRGEVLGLYRMPDATVFSIDVAVAKARNTAYYADATALVAADRVDFDQDGLFETISTSLSVPGDTLPLGTSLTNRTFRFLVEPRYPTGSELPTGADLGLVNDASLRLIDQRPDVAQAVGPQSILQLPGINPRTAENLDPGAPLAFSIYADRSSTSTLAYDAFVPARNFRDPGDGVLVVGTGKVHSQANQNGVVFFPGSTSLHRMGKLVGGFGVSGDGVDQDDVVTAGGQVGFAAPESLRVDQYVIGSVRLPFQKYNRNPQGE